MISLIEALDFRCLRYVRQPLGRFHVLVGPNASGKTTFLDVVSFLGRLVSGDLDGAVTDRTRNFEDLVWQRSGHRFELAIEAVIPKALRRKPADPPHGVIRYETRLGVDPRTQEISILGEKALLKEAPDRACPGRALFPTSPDCPKTIMTRKGASGAKVVVKKARDGNAVFYSEVHPASGRAWARFRIGPKKSGLGALPADESKFPVSTWLKGLLAEGVQQIILNSLALRQASPPGQGRRFKPDGSNLPWVVRDLKQKHAERHREWIAHLRTALADIEDIETVERPDDKHCYLVLCYRGGLRVPSWVASDGTLRLLALTLPAYLPETRGIYLIEEPENGIHPRAVESVLQSLSSVYDAQVLLATHSPVILSIAGIAYVLCFAKTPSGATDIVAGPDHPDLKDWQGEADLGVLLAAGVLG